jgi:hypothetical protein
LRARSGAAWYKTDHGIFEVWFLPRTESFATLEVVEQPQENGTYVYSFRGMPEYQGASRARNEYSLSSMETRSSKCGG